MKPAAIILLTALCAMIGLPAFAQRGTEKIFTGQGLLSGEVTETSAILHARFTALEDMVRGDVPGAWALACFELADNDSFAQSRRTGWTEANTTNDFILKARVDGLKPGTLYYYRVWFGLHTNLTQTDVARVFKTLQGPGGTDAISFVAGGSLNRDLYLQPAGGHPAGDAALLREKAAGYPAFRTLYRLRPDFFIGLGSVVNYEPARSDAAQTLADMRRKWHEQFIMPRLPNFFSIVPAYWLHPGSAAAGPEPSAKLMRQMFREQLPAAVDEGKASCRVHRVNRDLELWFVQPDERGILEAEQRAWLGRTMQQSDATFKVVAVPAAFAGSERQALAAGLRRKNISPERLFILSDRRWLSHVRHEEGIEEFTCGTLHRENAVLPPDASEGAGLFAFRGRAGGFLHAALSREAGQVSLRFALIDESGNLLYSVEKTATAP